MKTVLPSGPTSGFGFGLNLTNISIDFDDNDLFSAVNEIFPDDLFAVGEQISVGVDTADLPNSPGRAADPPPSTVHVCSIGVSTDGLVCCEYAAAAKKERNELVTRDDSPTMPITPPITPVEPSPNKPNLERTESLPDPSENGKPTNSSSVQRGEWDSSDENDSISDNFSMPNGHQRASKRHNSDLLSFSTPQPHRYVRLSCPSTVQPRKRPILLDPKKEPTDDRERRTMVRRPIWTRNAGTAEKTGEQEESRELRPRPVPPARFLGYNCGLKQKFSRLQKDTTGQYGSNEATVVNVRLDSTSPDAKNIRDPSETGNNDDGKDKTVDTEDIGESQTQPDSDQQVGTNSTTEELQDNGHSKRKLYISKRKQYFCSECGQECATQGGLNVHMESQHMGIRYRCKICLFTTNMTPTMGCHFSVHHRDRASERNKLVVKYTE